MVADKTKYAGGDAGTGNEQLLGICGICHDPLEDGIGADCGHAFCRVCVSEYLGSTEGTTTCPTCNRPLSIDLRAPASNCVLPPVDEYVLCRGAIAVHCLQ